MKKLILPIAALAIFSFASCKKQDNITTNVPKHNAATVSKTVSASLSSIRVSTQGFLVFPAREDLENYMTFLSTSTLAEVQQYHAALNFTSMAGQDYSETGPDDHLDEAQQLLFILDTKGIFQAENTLIKPVSSNQLLMTMQSGQLNKNSYTQFSSGTFDGGIMNQFAVSSSSFSNRQGILDIVGTMPSGINDTPVQPPMETMGWRVNRYYVDSNGDGIVDRYVDIWEYYFLGVCLWGGEIYAEGPL